MEVERIFDSCLLPASKRDSWHCFLNSLIALEKKAPAAAKTAPAAAHTTPEAAKTAPAAAKTTPAAAKGPFAAVLRTVFQS